MKTLVIGIGNLLLSDEGVGVHIARALQREELPSDSLALEVGTAFLDALQEVERADRIFIVDAMHGGQAPGTVYRVPFEECARPERIASLHGFDMSRVLYMSGRSTAPEVLVFGIEPKSIEWGTDLSPEVQASVPGVIKLILTELS